MNNIRLRENWDTGMIDVQVNSVHDEFTIVKSFGEYRLAAIHIKMLYNLTNEQLFDIYEDYKEDYDS